MASALKNLSDYNANDIPSGKNKRFGIVVSDYNSNITFALLEACYNTLLAHGVNENQVHIVHVPGAYELPLGAKILFQAQPFDAIIGIGCVITGETKHDDYINNAVSNAIMQLNIQHSTPFVFGLLTPRTLQQALDRAGGKHGNKGVEAAVTALKMAHLAQSLKAGSSFMDPF
jgi:6,7-dimethyl-8-ribityllumazine synthase